MRPGGGAVRGGNAAAAPRLPVEAAAHPEFAPGHRQPPAAGEPHDVGPRGCRGRDELLPERPHVGAAEHRRRVRTHLTGEAEAGPAAAVPPRHPGRGSYRVAKTQTLVAELALITVGRSSGRDFEVLVEDQAEGGAPVGRLVALSLPEQPGQRRLRGFEQAKRQLRPATTCSDKPFLAAFWPPICPPD
jgi:hypothetical protein